MFTNYWKIKEDLNSWRQGGDTFRIITNKIKENVVPTHKSAEKQHKEAHASKFKNPIKTLPVKNTCDRNNFQTAFGC